MSKKEEIDAFGEDFRKLKPQRITLSERDWQTFTEALENPAEPTEAAIKAMRKYREAGDEITPS